jgi:gamma-glutamyltranspeptidase/glutathione hydrolase
LKELHYWLWLFIIYKKMTDFIKIESQFKSDKDAKCSSASDGMIASQSAEASKIGKEILIKGGNAVDAAVACAFALGVSESQASGLGGQTMMLIGSGKEIIAIDGSSRAPSLAHASSVYENDKSSGYRATTVPSTPATLAYVHRKFGKLKWTEILKPVIDLAENGYEITELQAKLQIREWEKMKKVPSQSGIEYFFNNGKPYKAGEIFKQKDLAETLRRISKCGVEEFYRGKIAKVIDADMRENGGLLRYDDLALIPWPIERQALSKNFRGLDVYSMPPPGAGMTFLYALSMLNLIPANHEVFKDEKTKLHLIIKILRKAFLERHDRPYNPNFFAQISDSTKMLDDDFIAKSITEIMESLGVDNIPIIPSDDESSGETTHLSVIDKDGMAVSLTQSIERVYGSKAAAKSLGFIYNNYLFDFEYKHPEHPYYLRPNANPWATVSPSLLYKDNEIWMAIGSPGSERIVPTLLLFLHRVLDGNMSIDKAMKAPRIHCSLGGKLSLEANRFEAEVLDYFESKNYRIDKKEDFAFYLGCIQAVVKTENGFQAIADIRRDGAAL